MNDRIKESDWKVFKKLRPVALQRYCERVMGDIDKIIHKQEGSAHDRYIEMYKTVHDGDKKMADMFDGFSRSKAFHQLALYYYNDLLNKEEIDQLSDETREDLFAIIEFWKKY